MTAVFTAAISAVLAKAVRTAMIVAVLGLAANARPAAAQSLDDLYAKAKGEGEFAFYVGGPTAPWEARAKIFEERYPGIKITIGGGFSNVLDKKIDAQIAAGKLEVDAAVLQTAADYVRWKKEGRLIAFKPPGFDKMDANFKDADGTFWATMVNVVPYMYNTRKSPPPTFQIRRWIFLNPSSRAKSSLPIRRTTTSRSGYFITSCRNTAGATWTNTWQRSRTSFRAILANSAASAPDKTSPPSIQFSTSPVN